MNKINVTSNDDVRAFDCFNILKSTKRQNLVVDHLCVCGCVINFIVQFIHIRSFFGFVVSIPSAFPSTIPKNVFSIIFTATLCSLTHRHTA